jgi:ferrous iron transport protein A
MINSKETKALLAVGSGNRIRIIGFEAGNDLEGKLRQLGISPGDLAKVLRHAPLGGPVLIEINGREIALGESIAAKVLVEEIECVSP